MSYSPDWECDVFVSFKRVDPAQHFTRDLLKRLYEVGIAHCSDEKTNAPGEFKGNANKAFQQVRFALVVLSDRRFDGLVERLKGMKKPELVVIPICYPTDRAVTSRKFADALGKKANEISGYDLKANSTTDELEKLIDKIVERLINEIFSRPTNNTNEKVFGPFGHKNETSWRSHEIKNGISATYDKYGIKDITFEVKDGANTKQQYDRSGKDSGYKVQFEKEEHITSFAGYFDNVEKRITRLIFRTSKRMLGPFGEKTGEYFYVPSKGQKVTKFLAVRANFLTSIGAHVEQNSKKLSPDIIERVGLIGKRSGYKWDDGHHHANVRKIIGKYDSKSEAIRSIEFQYEEKDGKLWPLEIQGQMDGNNVPTEIEVGPKEHLTAIFGPCEHTEDYIKYLEFRTGEGDVQTIGVEKKNDEKTSISIPKGKIVGFYGWRRDEYLRGIGAYFERKPIQREVHWKDKEYFGVREICLWRDKTVSTDIIRAIRFVYDDGSEKVSITLDYPREYLTSISGCTQEDDVITSLIFHSNRGTYCVGHSVQEEGRFFWYPSTGSRITGFYGTFNNNALQSIGVYAEAIPHIYPLEKIGPYGGPEGQGVDWDDGMHTDVRAFRVSCDDHGIRSISFMYDDNGSLVECPQHGGGNAGKWIWLDFPNERLSSVTVWKVKKEKETIISHLQITTNAYPYGPYPAMSKEKPGKYEIKLERDCKPDGDPTRGRLRYNRVGFFGRAGKSYVNAIGAHYEPNY